MRRFGIAGLLIALLVLSAGASAAVHEVGHTGLRYDFVGPHGILTIAEATGEPFWVWNSNGMMVLAGVVTQPVVQFGVPNCGPNVEGVVLVVRVGETTFHVIGPDWMWE